MTLAELRQKPVGVLETRRITITSKELLKKEEKYYLVKREDGKYAVSFSEDGFCYFDRVSEEHMVVLLNDETLSKDLAGDIYFTTPQLSFWME